jgi:hypothetical protein
MRTIPDAPALYTKERPFRVDWWYCRVYRGAFPWKEDFCGMVCDTSDAEDMTHHADCQPLRLTMKAVERISKMDCVYSSTFLTRKEITKVLFEKV